MRFSFRGGIRPPANKESTANTPITNLPVPHHCAIPLLQHAGLPARSLVQPGDTVTEGQRIGEAQGATGAHIHASIPGKVRAIATVPTILGPQQAIVIDAGGSFAASAQQQRGDDWSSLDAAAIRERIAHAGLVDLGGAGVPVSLKLDPDQGKPAQLLIVNGVESEPYLTADTRLMETYPADILEGTRITMKALGVTRAIIAVGGGAKTARALRDAQGAADRSGITVTRVGRRHPQGAEGPLVFTLTLRRIPMGGSARDVGAVVFNVATIVAIREAVIFRKPLFERCITVSGGAIARPGNYKVRIGTRLSDIVSECGGLVEEPQRMVLGGPLGGVNVDSLEVPLGKGITGVLFLGRRESPRGRSRSCIRCGRCVAVCPMGLLPCDIGRAVEKNRLDLARRLWPDSCIRCGACAHVCPAKRHLVHLIDAGRWELAISEGTTKSNV